MTVIAMSDTALERICPICTAPLQRRRDESKGSWERRRCCSQSCSAKLQAQNRRLKTAQSGYSHSTARTKAIALHGPCIWPDCDNAGMYRVPDDSGNIRAVCATHEALLEVPA